MVKNLLCLAMGAVLFTGCVAVHKTETITDEGRTCKEPAQVLRHVVLVKLKDGTTSQQVKKIENTFCALPSKIDAIYDFEWGTDVSVENRSEGFTHCFVVTFISEADRAKYLPHPGHKELISILGPHLDKVIAVDYWTK
jgi:hypothetical protein